MAWRKKERLSPHFRVKELDPELYAAEDEDLQRSLVFLCENYLEPLRERIARHFGERPISITPSGGLQPPDEWLEAHDRRRWPRRRSTSQHRGQKRSAGAPYSLAADIQVRGLRPFLVGNLMLDLRSEKVFPEGKGGIGCYEDAAGHGFCHIDSRRRVSTWDGEDDEWVVEYDKKAKRFVRRSSDA